MNAREPRDVDAIDLGALTHGRLLDTLNVTEPVADKALVEGDAFEQAFTAFYGCD